MLIDTILQSKLDKIRSKHNEKLAKIRLQNELRITENKLKNELKLQELESENGQLEIKRDIFNLKNSTKKDTLTIKSGSKLKIFALITTLISTALTIAGGYKVFNHSIFTLISYVVAIIILQLTVYLIASQETRIKTEFYRHYNKVILLKYCLLGISIYSNYKFFASEVNSIVSCIIILALCISLDLIAIFLVSLAVDQKSLTFSYKEDRQKLFDRKNILYKLAFNVGYNVIYAIEKRYADNQKRLKNLDNEKIFVEVVNDNPVKQIEKVSNELLIADPPHRYKILNFDKKFKHKNYTRKVENTVKEIKKIHPDLSTKYSKVKAYLLDNLNSGEVVKTTDLKNKFKLSITEYRKILDSLKAENIVYTENKKTYMAKQLLKAVK